MTEENQPTEEYSPEEYSPEWITRIMELQGAAEGYKYKLNALSKPNTTPFPNFYMDWLMAYLTGEEWKVLSYIVRRTYGFHDEDIPKGIAVSCIANGFLSKKDGAQLELGTGLSTATICKALDFLEELGIIIVTKQMRAPTLYQINFGDDHRFPLRLSALATREAKLQKRLGPTMVAAAANAREELARKRAERKTIDLLPNAEQDSLSFSAQNTSGDESSFSAQNNSVLLAKTIKESIERKYIPQILSHPAQSNHPTPIPATIPLAGKGTPAVTTQPVNAVRNEQLRKDRAAKKVAKSGAAAILAAMPAEQAERARALSTAFLQGKAEVAGNGNHIIVTDEAVVAELPYMLAVPNSLTSEQYKEAVVYLCRSWGSMYVSPKKMIEKGLGEWSASGGVSPPVSSRNGIAIRAPMNTLGLI